MITQIVKFNVKPEHYDSFKAALIEDKQNAEQEEGFVEMRLFTDLRKPNIIFSYERWKDQDALDYHREHPYTVKICQLLDTALRLPLEILNLTETRPVSPINSKPPVSEGDVFIILFIFTFKEEFRDRLLKQFEKHVAYTREEEGCLLFNVYTIEGMPDTLFVYEHWRNKSAVWDVHFKQPYLEETAALLKEALNGDMEDHMHFVVEID